MKILKPILISVFLFLSMLIVLMVLYNKNTNKNVKPIVYDTASLSPSPLPTSSSLRYVKSGVSFEIPKKTQIFQTWNNCGPAVFSMLLSYYGIYISQQSLGEKLRPFQNSEGINDDKSVFLNELAAAAKEYNLTSYHRPNGNVSLLKTLVTNNIPVVTRTLLEADDDIGHFRLIRGFDEMTQEIIQDDSYQGADIRYSYQAFLKMWQPFNYEYLVLVPKEKEQLVMDILNMDADEKSAWKNANTTSARELMENPNDVFAKFNLSVSYYHLGEFANSVKTFEEVSGQLPMRMLWYQLEPIEAYLKTGNYDKVLGLTSNILSQNNLAYSEVYLLRSNAYKEMGNNILAKQELDKAYYYNNNSIAVLKALDSIN